MLPGLADRLRGGSSQPMELFNPLETLTKSVAGLAELAGEGPRFTTACGLCRWWDESHV